jgi:hypothetical protein
MSPNTESQLRSEATRGQRANELMADELIVEAFTQLNNRLTKEWADSPVRDSEGRERIWLMQKLLKNVGDHLSEIAQTGKLASLQLEQERTLVQKAKEWAKEVY